MALANFSSPSPEPALAARASTAPAEVLARLRAAQRRDGAPAYAHRRAALATLERVVRDARGELVKALADDFGSRSRHESLLGDVLASVNDARHARKRLRRWMRARRAPAGPLFPSRAEILPQPLGVVAILGPWNYPVQLTLGPLAAALAAGNRVIVKPSELTPATSALLARLLGDAFPPDELAVVTGGPEVGAAVAALPLDHLFFTGSAAVGRQILRAASEHLVPVTLELGGKSPVIVGPDASIDHAARIVVRGKLMNAGQTCVAPDYALVPEAQAAAFVEACRQHASRMYPRLVDNPDYVGIIDQRHLDRLRAHVADARARGGKVIEINPAGESFAPPARKLPPTLLLDVIDEMTVMQEEIFGPILPIETYASLDQAIARVNDRPHPLALYYFGRRAADIRRVRDQTVSGGVTVNEVMLHGATPELPFGGVGPSGMGQYHGRYGFETFSKLKPVVYTSRFNLGRFLEPPYGRFVERLLKMMLGDEGH